MTIIKYKSGTTWHNIIDLVYPVGSEVRGINIPSLVGGTWTKEIIKDKAVWIPAGQNFSLTDTSWHNFPGNNQWTLTNDHSFFSASDNRDYIYLEKENPYIAVGYTVTSGQSVGKGVFCIAVNGVQNLLTRTLETLNSGWHTAGLLAVLSGNIHSTVHMQYGSFDSAPHGTFFISAWSYVEIRPFMPLNIWKRTA